MKYALVIDAVLFAVPIIALIAAYLIYGPPAEPWKDKPKDPVTHHKGWAHKHKEAPIPKGGRPSPAEEP